MNLDEIALEVAEGGQLMDEFTQMQIIAFAHALVKRLGVQEPVGMFMYSGGAYFETGDYHPSAFPLYAAPVVKEQP